MHGGHGCFGDRLLDQGALKGTDLRGQTEPKRRFSQIFALIFADSLAFS